MTTGNNLGFDPDPFALDAAHQFADQSLIDLVASELESHRKAVRAKSTPLVKKGDRQANLLTLPAEEDIFAIDREDWYVLLSDLGVIESCADRMKLSMQEFITLVLEKFRVPNWHTFFWIREYLKLSERVAMSNEAGIREARQEAVKVHQAQLARSAANAKFERLYAKPKEMIQAEWRLHAAAYGHNKSAFARDYVGRVKHEFGIDITHGTIVNSWLAKLG
ncbi:hypothetical protein [Roseateles sp.]|uniref:hypothetical protein n=1 Tax=Roseateles sp. TaxID=1971397 RepID=UPI0039335E39